MINLLYIALTIVLYLASTCMRTRFSFCRALYTGFQVRCPIQIRACVNMARVFE